ncbi:hypothetical protein N7510_002484 [Penicillium lagena]|uniref:uncharacterized protein n=1 Tax=Penicillium lagena TaxID=94218 RepID=UPI002541E119|nr:uncharacterized protein N7510_002484 [Penicillium lagena]KAJ5626175.1 hypothetical protein N7510_002484 [Penicillium lagena]
MAAQNSLPALPLELWGSISSHLSNRDIKSLRLVCKQFSNAASPHVQRVFLSANPLNIEVFRAIADHKMFRHRVTEIIWDDARFIRGPRRNIHPAEEEDELLSDEDENEIKNEDKQCPKWFKNACMKNLVELRERNSHDVDRLDHIARAEQIAAQPPLKKNWEYYQDLLRQQEDVLVAKSDEDTFLYGLKQFPALKRVTITPAAHGHLFAPLYPTPMIRALPKGFNYPIPRGWPITGEGRDPPLAYPWQELNEAHKEKYRGFRIVTRVLAKEEHNVSELILNANQLATGINCTILDDPCAEYANLATVVKHPGLRRLDLALLVGGIDNEELNWQSFRNRRLHQALSKAKDMEDIMLYTTVIRDPSDDSTAEGGAGSLRHFIPLQSIFPIEKWSKLRHFELSRFLVAQSDVISLLSVLPETFRSVHLSFLKFLDNCGSWYSFLAEIRKQICENILWPDRDMVSRPKVTIGVSAFHTRARRGVWLEKEVHDYLYGEGEYPFYSDAPRSVKMGLGTERDTFEPNHDRPHDHRRALIEKGFVKPIE